MRKATFIVCLLALASFSVAAVDYPIGSWVDEIVYFKENDQSKVLDMMLSGDAHFFGNNFDSDMNPDIQASGLPSDVSYGSYNEYQLNPAGPICNDGSFNPFGIGKIREAMNWLIDRNYMIDEYFYGLGVPMFGMLNPNFPTAGSIGPTERELSITYDYDLDKAIDVITTEMTAAGCELVGGTWHYNGEEIIMQGLIRTEHERMQLGDYFCDQLELAGFATERRYGTSPECSAFWVSTDPWDNQWTFYTGGWIANTIDRSENSQHIVYDTPDGWGIPLWQAFVVPDEYYQLTQDFYFGNFADLEERKAMAAELERWTMSEYASFHIWLLVQAGTWAWAENVTTTVGTTSGVMGNPFFSRVARFVDADGAPILGGTLLIADPSMFVEPWNPVDGSNWLYDAQIYDQCEDRAAYGDPYTGLYFPHWIDHAVVEKNSDVIMFQTMDWVTMEVNDNIVPPAGALYDWDAVNQAWSTIGDIYPAGTTARTSVTIYFRDDLYDNYWHDGSQLTFADFYYKYIMSSARAQPESPYFDASTVSGHATGLETNKGMQVISTDPLVIKFWDDLAYFDAEEHAFQFAYGFTPQWAYGSMPWHVAAAALLGEEKQEFAFSEDKAVELGVDRVSFIAGPSLELLKVDAAEAANLNFVPWPSELLDVMDPAEPFERYNNMIAFLETYGHLWIGNGPMMVTEVDTVAQQIVISRFEDYKYTNEAFMQFATPRYADISMSGPEVVVGADGATYDVTLTFQGEAYPAADISSLAWLIVDANNTVAASGDATIAGDGAATIALSADVLSALPEGSTTLEVIAVLVPVAKPSYGSTTFLLTQ